MASKRSSAWRHSINLCKKCLGVCPEGRDASKAAEVDVLPVSVDHTRSLHGDDHLLSTVGAVESLVPEVWQSALSIESRQWQFPWREPKVPWILAVRLSSQLGLEVELLSVFELDSWRIIRDRNVLARHGTDRPRPWAQGRLGERGPHEKDPKDHSHKKRFVFKGIHTTNEELLFFSLLCFSFLCFSSFFLCVWLSSSDNNVFFWKGKARSPRFLSRGKKRSRQNWGGKKGGKGGKIKRSIQEKIEIFLF